MSSSRSFKVADFETDRKPIYDFPLVINTNLAILHPFQVMVNYWSNFSLTTGGRFTLTPSLGVITCEYIAKTAFFGLHFTCRMCPCIFNHFYVNRPQMLYRIRQITQTTRPSLRRSISF